MNPSNLKEITLLLSFLLFATLNCVLLRPCRSTSQMESTQWQIQFAKLQIANDMEMASFAALVAAVAADDAAHTL